MLQQAVAVSTAVLLGVSFLPTSNLSNANEIPHSHIAIGTLDPDMTGNILSESDNRSTQSPAQYPGGETASNPGDAKPKHQDSLTSAGVPVGVKVQSGSPRGPISPSFNLPTCGITQTEDAHHTAEGGHSFAQDIACVRGVSYDVPAPSFKGFYLISYIGTDDRLGNYVVLKHGEERWVYGHTQTSRKAGQRVTSGEIIGQSNDSGHAYGIHTHVEYWSGKVNKTIDGKRTNEFSEKLCTQREWAFCKKKTQVSGKTGQLTKYYFTHYDLGDINQNDSAPCHGASGADLCFLARQGVNTMALTADIRKSLGVKFGDKVILEGDAGCAGIYEVHDEMNKRYRTSCQLRPGTNYCIKGDLPGKPGGACTVQKIKY